MSAFPGTWAEYIEFEVVFARLAAAGGAAGEAAQSHVEALRERAVNMAAEQGMRAIEAACAVETEFYEGQIAARR
jgi:hypothetical protein